MTTTPTERAFFAYLVRRWYRAKPAANSIIYCLQRDLMADSLYVRQNAFEAMAHVGEAPLLAHALEALDGRGEGHSPRLVTETLLASACNQDILASALDARLEALTPQTASAVINYLRMKSAGSPKHLLVLMGDARTDREVRLACVRYFMRNPHPCALPITRGSRAAPTPRRGSSPPSPPWRSPPTPAQPPWSCSRACFPAETGSCGSTLPKACTAWAARSRATWPT